MKMSLPSASADVQIHCAVSMSLQVNPCSVRVYLRPNSPMNEFASNFACASVNVSKMCIIKLQNVSGFNLLSGNAPFDITGWHMETKRRTDRKQYTRSNAATARLLTLVKPAET